MTAHQQRHQLVADVAIARRAVVLVALGEQHREHRVLAGVGVAAAVGEQRQQLGVEALHRGPEAAPGAARAEIAPDERHRQHLGQRAHARQRALDHVAQPRHLVAAGAEYDPQDDLQRQLPHPLQGADRPLPGRQLLVGDRSDRRRERTHPVAVKRRGQQPPLTQVRLPVEQQDRIGAGERRQEVPALAGRRDRRVKPEDVADRVGAREQDHRLLGPVGADRHRVPEAAMGASQKRARAGHPGDRLPGGRGARTGRQLHDGRCYAARAAILLATRVVKPTARVGFRTVGPFLAQATVPMEGCRRRGDGALSADIHPKD
jgi:hypothetical protein